MPIFIKGHQRKGHTVKGYMRSGNPSRKASEKWRSEHFKALGLAIQSQRNVGKYPGGAFNWRNRVTKKRSDPYAGKKLIGPQNF